MPVKAFQQAAVSAGAATPATAFPWVPLDLHLTPFHVNYLVSRSGSGQAKYRVQGTMDDVLDPAVSANAYTLQEMASVQGVTAFSREVSAPWSAVRIIVASASASSNLAFRVTQAGT